MLRKRLILFVLGLAVLTVWGCIRPLPLTPYLEVEVLHCQDYESSTLIKVGIYATDMGSGNYLLEENPAIAGWHLRDTLGAVGMVGLANEWLVYLRKAELPCILSVIWTDGARTEVCMVEVAEE